MFARWTASGNRATNAPYAITHAGGTTQVAVNQKTAGGAWNSLGTYSFSPGTAHKVTLTDQANGYVIADGVRLVPISIPTGAQVYYVSADHLNTPRLVADATGTTVWRWDQVEPFGNNPADENPSALGAFDLPLRLPGQRYDAETGLHYNYFRDYDPAIGRYAESDPIGLRGGLNTYAYVEGQPLLLFDQRGDQPWLQAVIAVGGAAVGLFVANSASQCELVRRHLEYVQAAYLSCVSAQSKGMSCQCDQLAVDLRKATDDDRACTGRILSGSASTQKDLMIGVSRMGTLQ